MFRKGTGFSAREERRSYARAEGDLPFYEALVVNDSAVKVLGDETLKNIAPELVVSVKQNATTDRTLKQSV